MCIFLMYRWASKSRVLRGIIGLKESKLIRGCSDLHRKSILIVKMIYKL